MYDSWESMKIHRRCLIVDVPQDPIILVSFVNTKLRDQFATLEEFCKTYDVDEQELRTTLEDIDYQYDETTNQLV